MNSNPLPPVWEAYKITKDALKVVKRSVKTRNTTDRQRLLQRTLIFNQQPNVSNVDNISNAAELEVDELFVVDLWATFERFLRSYLQNKGFLLTSITPADLGEAIYSHFFEEVEYWKPDEILDFLKLNLLKHNPQLAGEAKAIYHYRSWIVHGKSDRTSNKSSPISTEMAYATLDDIIQILLANMSETTITAVFEKGIFRPVLPLDTAIAEGQEVQLFVINTKPTHPNPR